MKKVIEEKIYNDVVLLENVDNKKIYIWKDTNDNKWYKITNTSLCDYLSISLESTLHHYGSLHSNLVSAIKYILDCDFDVYEFDTLKEMVSFLNKNITCCCDKEK